MDALIHEFRTAFVEIKGDRLAETLHPDVQANAAKLQALWGRGNVRDVTADLDFLFYSDPSRPRMSQKETAGWVEIYLSYWKAVGEILAVEGLRSDAKVCSLFLIKLVKLAFSSWPQLPIAFSY